MALMIATASSSERHRDVEYTAGAMGGGGPGHPRQHGKNIGGERKREGDKKVDSPISTLPDHAPIRRLAVAHELHALLGHLDAHALVELGEVAHDARELGGREGDAGVVFGLED
ncbi:hypothetical protein CVT25_006353, partial [Psilocybe cyanescens]